MAAQRENVDIELEQKLKSSLWFSVGKICEEICEEKDMEADKQFVAVLAEITYKHASVMAQDMEAFAKHAKRSTINCDDVKLFVRKTPKLHSYLDELEQTLIEDKRKNKKTNKSKAKSTSVAE